MRKNTGPRRRVYLQENLGRNIFVWFSQLFMSVSHDLVKVLEISHEKSIVSQHHHHHNHHRHHFHNCCHHCFQNNHLSTSQWGSDPFLEVQLKQLIVPSPEKFSFSKFGFFARFKLISWKTEMVMVDHCIDADDNVNIMMTAWRRMRRMGFQLVWAQRASQRVKTRI